MLPVVKRILKLTLGWLFIILGVLGLFLPLLQGFLFLAIGLAVLSTESTRAKKILIWLKRKYPKPYARFALLKRKLFKRFAKNTTPYDEGQNP